MIIIDGKKVAVAIIARLKKLPTPTKKLVAVLVGEDPGSVAFLRRKAAIAKDLGVDFELRKFSADIGQKELERAVAEIEADNMVGGVLVQLPLPPQFNRERVLALIPAEKDVDALTDHALVEAPAVGVVRAVLENVELGIRNYGMVAVVGRGLLVGGPIARWLEQEKINNKKLKIKVADSKTENLAEFLSDADLVITGVGKAGLIKPEWLKAGAGVIDFGFPADFQISDIRYQTSEIRNPKSEIRNLGFYTPTPGGTGPILVAKLFENFYRLCAQ